MTEESGLPPLDPFKGVPERRHHLAAAELLGPLLEPNAASRLRWRRQATNAPIVSVEDRYITGRLDLRGADLDYLFRFERCRFEHPPDIREAKLLGLVLRKCWLPGLKARNLTSRNDVRLIRCLVDVEHAGPDTAETTVRRAQDRERGVPDAAINLTDAVIEGSMVLTRTEIRHPLGRAIQADRLVISGALLAYRLRADGEVRLPGVRTGGNVALSGARLRNPDGLALDGNGLHVGGSLLGEVDSFGGPGDRRPFTCSGVLYLPSARVDGDMVFRGARVSVGAADRIVLENWRAADPSLDPRPAVFADRVRVDGNVEFSDAFAATGTLRMVNARIGGSLRLAGGRITVPRGLDEPLFDRALHLDGTEIDGDLQAGGLQVPSGQLRLADMRIGGNLLAAGVGLHHAERDVFSARRTEVAGNLHLTNAEVKGTLRLQGMRVGGSVELYGTQLTAPAVREPTSFSLDLRTAHVGRDVLLTANRERAFHAAGGVVLDGATVGRRLNLNEAELRSRPEHGVALDASDVTADEFVLRPRDAPVGQVVLRRAHCGTLGDNHALWHASGGMELEDFRYDVMKTPIEVADDDALDRRIEWLRAAMGRYRPGPYDQLAAMLRTSGNEEHADTVLLRKQEHRYAALAGGFSPVPKVAVLLWSRLQRWMVGYGYRPARALGWLLMLLVAGSVWFGLGSDDCTTHPDVYQVSGPRCVINRDDSGLEWNSTLYTVDLLVPIIDFGNKSRWYMSGADKWVSTAFTASGWLLATTVAAGVGRTVRRG